MSEAAFFTTKTPRKDILSGLGASFAVHFLVVFAIVLYPMLGGRKSAPIPFYQVRLVTPQEAGIREFAAPKLHNPTMQSRAKRKPRVQEPPPVMPVKRLQYDHDRSRVALKNRETSAPQPVVRTPVPTNEPDLDKLLPKPKDTPAPKAVPKQVTRSDPEIRALDSIDKPEDIPAQTPEASAPSAQAAEDEDIGLAQRLYYTEVWNAIRSQWALPSMFRTSKLEAIIVLTVRRDGRILRMNFEKRSGSEAFDESALRAVRKANPLPPFPEIYSPRQVEIGVRFRPEDLH